MNREKRPVGAAAFALGVLLLGLLSCCYAAVRRAPALLFFALPAFLLLNVFPPFDRRGLPSFRLRVCAHGAACLRLFAWSLPFGVVYHIAAVFFLFPSRRMDWVWSAAVCACALSVVFWNGMLSVYLASVQLGVRRRAVGLLCGFIPVANLIMLRIIIKTVSDEVGFETEKAALDAARRGERLCRTKYPILLVHGVFFRDYKFPNYWGRIPRALENNGARVFYGNHQSAAGVADSARELNARIKEIVEAAGCEKVNIIAHSKGGLDCRWALGCLDAAPYVASLTTVNTPHRGCGFADYLLEKIPEKARQKIADTYNEALKKLGDDSPDFMAAVRDLTAAGCRALGERMGGEAPGVFCQSVGSRLNRAANGKFPLNFTYGLVKYFDGPNDGLVAESSFRWGERYTYLTVRGKRGISHGDVIDLNRENIPEFDVREFYVGLVADLKRRGL